MLKRALENMPKTKEDNRLEIPKPDVLSGKKTEIKNFILICKTMRREPSHVAKFFFRELAVPGNISGKILSLQGRIPYSTINEKIQEYIKKYLKCNECGKLDTNLKKQGKILNMKCEACGANKTIMDM